MDATLASRPSKPGVSRFKAERQGRIHGDLLGGQSISLGTTLLPGHRASALQRAVRNGELADDKLFGPAEDSASEGEDAQNVSRTMELLKNGIVVGAEEVSATASQARAPSDGSSPSPNARCVATNPTAPPSESLSVSPSCGRPTPTAETQVPQKPPNVIRTPPAIQPTPSSSSARPQNIPTVPPSPRRSSPTHPHPPNQNQPQPPTRTQTQSPTETRSGRGAFPSPLVPPDPAVLTNTIVDSPSFPRPLVPPPPASSSASASASSSDRSSRSQREPLVQEVRESTRRAGARTGRGGEEEGGGARRPSRFLAERMGMEVE